MVTKIENNKCGECTLCCELLPIPEIGKSENVLCTDCTLKKGCNIYNERPESCVNFDCLYISSNEMELELRPDNCNVIFDMITTKIYMALNHYNDPFAYENKNVIDYIKKLNSQGISVITTSFTDTPNEFFLAEGHDKDIVWKIAMREYEKIK